MVRLIDAPEADHLKYGQEQLMNVDHGRSHASIFRSQALEGPTHNSERGIKDRKWI